MKASRMSPDQTANRLNPNQTASKEAVWSGYIIVCNIGYQSISADEKADNIYCDNYTNL